MQKSLANLTEEDFEAIKDLAALFFTPREIAMMQELETEAFILECNNPHSRCYEAFHSGRLQSEVDLRRSIIKLAKSGSSPAQTMALDMQKQSKIKMLDR